MKNAISLAQNSSALSLLQQHLNMENITFEEIKSDDEIGRIINDEIVNEFSKKYILLGEDRTCLSELYIQYENDIKNLEVYNDDIWVIAYPKSGTTWTQEMVWMLANNLDFEAGKTPLSGRVPFLELHALMDRYEVYKALNRPDLKDTPHLIDIVRNMPRPRIIKTHLPFSLLPEQIQNGTKSPRIICTVRNPKDACVSFYHHGCLLNGWRTDLESFAKVFLADKSLYGSYWKHLFGYWNRRHLLNILVLKYEDMKSDLSTVIKKVAQFLEKTSFSEEQVDLLEKHLSFESMQSNPAVNANEFTEKMRICRLVVKDGKFIRSGTVGKYKEELSPETIADFNKWIERNIKGTNLENEEIFRI